MLQVWKKGHITKKCPLNISDVNVMKEVSEIESIAGDEELSESELQEE